MLYSYIKNVVDNWTSSCELLVVFYRTDWLMEGDAVADVRMAVICSLPCPPLPMLMNRGLDEKWSDFCNSHDFLAHLMNVASKNPDEARDFSRYAVQQVLTTQLLQGIDRIVPKKDHRKLLSAQEKDAVKSKVEGLFHVFFRGYVSTYLTEEQRKRADIRFKPAVDVGKGDKIHVFACSHLAGQDMLRKREKCRKSASLQKKSYEDVLYLFACEMRDEGEENPAEVMSRNTLDLLESSDEKNTGMFSSGGDGPRS